MGTKMEQRGEKAKGGTALKEGGVEFDLVRFRHIQA